MPDYQLTKIYYILVGDDKYYIHTTQPLSARTSGHRSSFRNGWSMKLYTSARALGLSDSDLVCVWIEDYPCANIEQARARERYHVERDGELNMRIPGRTLKESADAAYHKNKDKHLEYRKVYRTQYIQTHKEFLNAKNRAYALKNPEAVKEYKRKSAEKHREATNERVRTRRAAAKSASEN
jgi:hypothetical protein